MQATRNEDQRAPSSNATHYHLSGMPAYTRFRKAGQLGETDPGNRLRRFRRTRKTAAQEYGQRGSFTQRGLQKMNGFEQPSLLRCLSHRRLRPTKPGRSAPASYLCHLFPKPLDGQSPFETLFLAGLHVEGVLFRLANNVFLLYFPFETAESTFQ